MLPILERHTASGNTELNASVWIVNAELAYKKCVSESEKNRYNLRSN
ncbi:hypothetical protein LEP1GSC199_1165 [Leptospira vanthielii serovar Holland str. Waz Holland = ATCC 700522]|uniref:Uncharacterized protein n=1 Tax=Leptospira vanthielii serovar Holland str. Waz Holland = ATCC 700522 TaxID=1218591 RepID=N1VV74_9LEPT|nr:hypothetical protein LEP1GSC199_1165 [Leptospira vanthielii serovar Holland str. Waz Holland = ATCC 700522]